jgi:hypothetical protein
MIKTAKETQARNGKLKMGNARASATPETRESRRRAVLDRVMAPAL